MRPGAARVAVLALCTHGATGCGGSPKARPDFTNIVPSDQPTRAPVEEPQDAGDDMQVTSTVGHVEPTQVDSGLSPHRAALTGCYIQQVGGRTWLGGHVLLRWMITATGAVTRVVLVESDLGAWPVEKCLLDVARGVTFGKPVGGPAELTLPLTFSPVGQPVAWDTLQSVRAVGGMLDTLDACSGNRDTKSVEVARPPDKPVKDTPGKGKSKGNAKAKAKANKKTKAKGSAATTKSETAAQRPSSPPQTGRSTPIKAPSEVSITLYVGRNGRVESVGFASATGTLEDDWATCAEKIALDWQLPDPKGQVAKLGVRYRPR